MKRVLSLALLPVGVLLSARAEAANEYLCCDLAAQDQVGACIAQGASCAQSDPYGIALSDISGDAGGFPEPAGVTTASFPAGTDGHLSWNKGAPWVGFCLDAPSTQDPSHAGPTEPIGCLAVSLASGIGAQVETAQFPVSSQWDGYQLCYGAPVTSSFLQYGEDGERQRRLRYDRFAHPGIGFLLQRGSALESARRPRKQLERVERHHHAGIAWYPAPRGRVWSRRRPSRQLRS
jgi:hypothetical protein